MSSRSFFDSEYVLRIARWWVVVLVLVVLGAAAGFASSKLSPYKSDVLFRINTDSPDSTRVTQLAQTSVRLVDADRVYDSAAAQVGISSRDLRNKTVVGWISDSELITITVEGPTAEASQRYADAFAAAASAQVRDLAEGQLADSRNGTDAVLATGSLEDRVAEDARRQALGQATATRQDSALASAVLLTQIGGVSPAVHSGVSPVVGAFAGAAGGAAVGVLFALTLGARIGRVRRRSDVLSAVPSASVLSLEQVPTLIDTALQGEAPLIGVLYAKGTVGGADDLLAAIIAELRGEGRRPLVRALDSQPSTSVVFRPEAGSAALEPRRRSLDLARARADCLLAVGLLDERNLARLRGRAQVVAVRIELGVRVAQLRPLARLAEDTSVAVVVEKGRTLRATRPTAPTAAVASSVPDEPDEADAVTTEVSVPVQALRTGPAEPAEPADTAEESEPAEPAEEHDGAVAPRPTIATGPTFPAGWDDAAVGKSGVRTLTMRRREIGAGVNGSSGD